MKENHSEQMHQIPLPVEVTCNIMRNLDTRSLFFFAQTDSINRHLAYEELFTRPPQASDIKAQEHLLRYWSENPTILLQKSLILPKKFSGILKRYAERNAGDLSCSVLKSVYICLMMLSAAEKNIDQFQENFVRLAFISHFDVSVLLSVLVKMSIVLGDHQSVLLFQSFLKKRSQLSHYPKFLVELLINHAPIDESLSKVCKQALMNGLKNSTRGDTSYHHHISTLNRMSEILTSEEALCIIQLLLDKIFDPDYEKFFQNYLVLKKPNDRYGVLKNFLPKLNSNSIDWLYHFLTDLIRNNHQSAYPSEMLAETANLIKFFSERFNSEQNRQCFILLLACTEESFSVNDAMRKLLKRSESKDFIYNLKDLVNSLYLKHTDERSKQLNLICAKEYLKISNASKGQLREINEQASRIQEEFILFLKLINLEANEEVFDSTFTKTAGVKLLSTTCQLITLHCLPLMEKNNKFCKRGYEIVANFLNRKDLSYLKNLVLLNSSDKMVQDILMEMYEQEQSVCLEDLYLPPHKAADHFFEFFYMPLPNYDKFKIKILLQLSQHLGRFSYIYLEKIIKEQITSSGYLIKSLSQSITIKQAEELCLTVITKLQNKNVGVDEQELFTHILETLIIKLPIDKQKNIYLPKLLDMKEVIAIRWILISKFSNLLSNEVIEKLISQFLIEIKNGRTNLVKVLENVSDRFTETHITTYYEYLLTCEKFTSWLNNNKILIQSLIKRFTADQLGGLFHLFYIDFSMQEKRNFCLRTAIRNASPWIDFKNLYPFYLVLQKEVDSNGGLEGDLCCYEPEDQSLVKELFASVLKFISPEPQCDLDDVEENRKSKRLKL